MSSKHTLGFSPTALRKKFRAGMTVRNYRDNEVVFSQGDTSDAVFYIQNSTVKLTAVSTRRKKAIIAFLQRGTFFGEGCLGGQSLRICTARSIGQSNISRLRKESTLRTLKRSALCNVVCCISAFPDYSNRGRPGRSILQFQRKATGAGSVAVWANRQGIKAGVPPEGEPRNPGGDGWYHPRKGK